MPTRYSRGSYRWQGDNGMVPRIPASPAVDDMGEIIIFGLAGANVVDRNPKLWKVMSKDLYGKVFADRGYIFPKLFDTVLDDGISTTCSKTRRSTCIPDIVR